MTFLEVLKSFQGSQISVRLRSADSPSENVWYGTLQKDPFDEQPDLSGWYVALGTAGVIDLFLDRYADHTAIEDVDESGSAQLTATTPTGSAVILQPIMSPDAS